MRNLKTSLIAICTIISAVAFSQYKFVNKVNPFIGTGGHGHTYPGASMPFGMVQLSPDTRLEGWDGCGGYHYTDTEVYGFSHTHLSGTGIADYCDILFMPTTGEVRFNNGADGKPGYKSKFDHKNETAEPGYYSVKLDDYNVNVDLTVTRRSGMHKYTFPKSKEANVILDLKHRDIVLESTLEIIGDTAIQGYRRSRSWSEDQRLYFYAVFSKPFKKNGIALNDTLKSKIAKAEGRNIKAYFQFQTEENEAVYLKVGISAVSMEGAKNNLLSENKGWDFEATKKSAQDAWEKELSKIEVKGGTDEQQKVFYTALYHSFLNPNLFSDADGKYLGTDKKIHTAYGFDYYTIFSLWDTYRATHPLFTITQHEKTNHFIKTFNHMYREGGKLPVWELASNYTGCMIGYHSIPVIADAYVKGIRGYDAETAFEGMKHSAMLDHLGLKYYKEMGYIPASLESESVSKTLEYAYDDWCIAQMARELGHPNDYNTFIERAQFFKNVFDPTTGFMRGKVSGVWFEPFHPEEVNFNYTEANSWQYSFYAPQDITGFYTLLGGKDQLDKKLDLLFTTSSETKGRHQADITGLIGQYAHGNEPSHHMAYLYNYINKPWKTQSMVRRIMKEMYSNQPDGLSGNEDCGQMSSWYVLSAMGIYPVTPGQTQYAIGSPIFEEVKINLENGNTFTIKANGVSEANKYIQTAKFKDARYNNSFIEHQDIMNGGEIVFTMGPEPNNSWGTLNNNIPVTHISENKILPVPYFVKGDRVFEDSCVLDMSNIVEGAHIFYTLDESEPNLTSKMWKGPMTINKTTVVKAFAVKEGYPDSRTVTASFHKIPEGRTIDLQSKYASQYNGGGDMALLDGIRGPENFITHWQGFQKEDLVAIVDLGSVKSLNKIGCGFLQDQRSWIFMPEEVKFEVSNDGKNYKELPIIKNTVNPKDIEVIIKDFEVETKGTKAQYIKMTAKNKAICPDWHRGAGGKAWIFADEITIN